MNVKWQPTYRCPYGCEKFFGSSVALNWHVEKHKLEVAT